MEENESTAFSYKPRQYAHEDSPIRFNGARIREVSSGYELFHDCLFQILKTLDPDHTDKADFISQRAMDAHISAVY